MANSDKRLNEGEHVVVSTRTHVKVLLGALVVLLVTVFVAAFLAALVDRNLDGVDHDVLMVAVVVIALVIILGSVARRFVAWYTTTYTVTNRRFLHSSGFIAKKGTSIPLNRISEVDFDIGLTDRLFGCGTLYVSDASEQGRVALKDIPRVEEVQRIVADELHRTTGSNRSASADDGT